MAMVRLIRIAALVGLAFTLAGCGAKNQASSSMPSGGDFAPASSVIYVTGITDPASSQWQKAEALLGRFPGHTKLLADAQKDLAKDGLSWEKDLKPALGDELNFVLLSYTNPDDNAVFFTKPKDEAKFNKALEAGKPEDRSVHRRIDGWTVFADTEKALDNFAAAHATGKSLADESSFEHAMNGLSDEALLRAYVAGKPLAELIQKMAERDAEAQAFKSFSDSFGKMQYLSFSSMAEDDGVPFQIGYKASEKRDSQAYKTELDSTLPAGALAYFSFGNLERAFDRALKGANGESPQLQQLEQGLGFNLKDDVLPLFSKEGALAMYRGGEDLVPSVLFASRLDDEDKATELINRLAAFAGLAHVDVRPVLIQDAKGKVFSYAEDNLTIYAVVGEGKLLVSNSRSKIEDALGDGAKLSDDAVYKEALDTSSTPDETEGLAYVNLKLTLPLLFESADAFATGSVPPDVRANIKPLRSAILYSKQDGDRQTVSGFVTIK
jgi:hypothetical protein